MTVQAPVPLPTLPPSPPPKRGNVWRIVVGVVAAVTAIVVIGVVLMNNSTSKTAAPTGLRLVGKTAVTATIAWQPGSSTLPAGYKIYRDDEQVGTTQGDATRFRDTGLVPSTTYVYQVTAQSNGRESAKSNALSVTTPAASLASARLAGSYAVHLRVTSENGYTNFGAGHTEDVEWIFTPRASGATKLAGESWAGDGWVMTLRHSGRAFTGRTTEAISTCYITPVETSIAVALRVSAADAVGSSWTATKFTGTLTQIAPRTVSVTQVCPGARFTATVSGTLQR